MTACLGGLHPELALQLADISCVHHINCTSLLQEISDILKHAFKWPYVQAVFLTSTFD